MGGCGASSAPEHLKDEANLLQVCDFRKAAPSTPWLTDLNPQERNTAKNPRDLESKALHRAQVEQPLLD